MIDNESTRMESEVQGLSEILKNYIVIRDLSEKEEPSQWTKSQFAIDTRTNEKVLISKLDPIKFKVYYSVIPQSGLQTDEEREEIRKKAQEKYESELRGFVERYKKVAGLSHPNIAKVIDVGIDQNKEAIVVTEKVEGVPIFDATDGMSILGMIPIFLDILQALNFIHSKDMLHLNLKSSRILVKADYPSQTKLTDYGYAIDTGNIPDRRYGSATTAAPEVLMGEIEKIGETADLYSFAVIAYYCMCRNVAFKARGGISDILKLRDIVKNEHEPMYPSKINTLMLQKECDKESAGKIQKLEGIIMDELKPNPDDRPVKTARELAKKISELFQDELNKKKFGDTTTSKSLSSL
ncbi:MAG: protein kinase [Pseudomonadota bacterium]